MFIIYLFKISEKGFHFSNVFIHVFLLCINKVNDRDVNTSSIYHVFIKFIFHMVFRKFYQILGYFCILKGFGFIGIHTNLHFQIHKRLSNLLNFNKFFLKKALKNTKKQNSNTKQISFTSMIVTKLMILTEILLIFILVYFENLNEPKDNLEIINETMFMRITQNPSIMPLFSMWLNDNMIIWKISLGCESESIDQGRSYEENNINISNCFFSRFQTYSGSGGVIYVSILSYSMLINSSMFYNCACTGEGGAIHFFSKNSCLRMICANSCSSSSYPHFAWLEASELNQGEFLSVSYCSNSTSGYYPIVLQSGNQRVDHTNSSMNKAERVSGIGIHYTSSFTSSHCTFSNNKAFQCQCIYLYPSLGTISLSYANIVHNNSPSLGIILVQGSNTMVYCIFQSNQDSLFCVWDGSLEVSHSFIDHSGSFSTSTAVSTSNNNSFTNIITYQIQYFNSLHCNADLPLIEPKQMITFVQTYMKSTFFIYPVIILMIS